MSFTCKVLTIANPMTFLPGYCSTNLIIILSSPIVIFFISTIWAGCSVWLRAINYYDRSTYKPSTRFAKIEYSRRLLVNMTVTNNRPTVFNGHKWSCQYAICFTNISGTKPEIITHWSRIFVVYVYAERQQLYYEKTTVIFYVLTKKTLTEFSG